MRVPARPGHSRALTRPAEQTVPDGRECGELLIHEVPGLQVAVSPSAVQRAWSEARRDRRHNTGH